MTDGPSFSSKRARLQECSASMIKKKTHHTALALAEHIGAAPDLKVAPVLDTELATLADRLGGGGGARLRVTVVVAVVADWPSLKGMINQYYKI